MFFRNASRRVKIGALVLLLAAISVPFWHRPAATSNNLNSTARSTYADLYQAVWRQDSGQGSLLMTATVYPPELTQALGAVTDRTSLEEQQWNLIHGLKPSELGIFVTLDSVGGAIPDAAMVGAAGLVSDVGVQYAAKRWEPLVTTSHLVNAPAGATAQAGFLVFQSDHDLAWPAIRNLTLRIRGLAGVTERTFAWPHPATISPDSL